MTHNPCKQVYLHPSLLQWAFVINSGDSCFTSKLKVADKFPDLEGVMAGIPDLHSILASSEIMESLLSYFFSPLKSSYRLQDVAFFLRLANEQIQWCYKDREKSVQQKLVRLIL